MYLPGKFTRYYVNEQWIYNWNIQDVTVEQMSKMLSNKHIKISRIHTSDGELNDTFYCCAVSNEHKFTGDGFSTYRQSAFIVLTSAPDELNTLLALCVT